MPDTIPRAHSPLVRGGEKKPTKKPLKTKPNQKIPSLIILNIQNIQEFHMGFLLSTGLFSSHFYSTSQLIYSLITGKIVICSPSALLFPNLTDAFPLIGNEMQRVVKSVNLTPIATIPILHNASSASTHEDPSA